MTKTKFKEGDSVSKSGSGTIPGYVVKVFDITEHVPRQWYAVRWLDGNEDVYHEDELWPAV